MWKSDPHDPIMLRKCHIYVQLKWWLEQPFFLWEKLKPDCSTIVIFLVNLYSFVQCTNRSNATTLAAEQPVWFLFRQHCCVCMWLFCIEVISSWITGSGLGIRRLFYATLFFKSALKMEENVISRRAKEERFSLRTDNLGFILQGFNTMQCFSSTFHNSGLQYDILVYVTLFSFSNQSIWRRTAVLFNTRIFFCAVPLCKSVCFYNLCICLGRWTSLSLLIANLRKYWIVGANECKIWSVRLQNFS